MRARASRNPSPLRTRATFAYITFRKSLMACVSSRAFSAGSQPKGQVNPRTLALLQGLGYDTAAVRSKSWNEFAKPGAPALDFVFTVCDNAAGETCPFWPGQPMTAHWGVPDPPAIEGSEEHRRQAFRDACRQLEERIKLFTALPIDKLDRMSLKRRADQIGRSIEHEKT